MSKIQVQVEVSKETYELGQGLAKIVEAVLVAVADGFQVGTDLPAIAVAAFGQMTAIEGVDKIPQELKDDPEAFVKALALGLADIYKAVKAKDEVVG